MINFALLLLSASLLMYLDNSIYTEAILISALVVSALLNRKNINNLHLSTVILCVVAVETLIQASEVLIPSPPILNVWKNSIIYSTYLGFDILAFTLVIFRVSLSRGISNQHEQVRMTNADILLMSVYGLFVVINVLALGENIIRNLEHFGIAENVAKTFWSWDFIYYNYPNAKRAIIALQLFAVFLMIKDAIPIKRQKVLS